MEKVKEYFSIAVFVLFVLFFVYLLQKQSIQGEQKIVHKIKHIFLLKNFKFGLYKLKM